MGDEKYCNQIVILKIKSKKHLLLNYHFINMLVNLITRLREIEAILGKKNSLIIQNKI